MYIALWGYTNDFLGGGVTETDVVVTCDATGDTVCGEVCDVGDADCDVCNVGDVTSVLRSVTSSGAS